MGLTSEPSSMIIISRSLGLSESARMLLMHSQSIGMATGQYIQFVDADDHLIKMPYEHCLDIIRHDKNIDMVMFDFTNSQQQQKAYNDSPIVSGTEHMRNHNIHGTAWGYLFKMTTLSELRFTPGIWHEDEEFTPQLLIRAERICVTDAKAYFYYKHSGTITTHSDDESKEKRFNDIMGVLKHLNYLTDRVPQNDRVALQRRVAQLTMDYIYQVIIQRHSMKALNNCLEELRNEGLFPLPDRDYSQKYKWFRKMTKTSFGRIILLNTLPLLKKER